MKFSRAWLTNLLGQTLDHDALVSGLTMAGLEVDACEPVAKACSGVVVGEIKVCEPHPNADKLRVTQIDVGLENDVQVVCGASNARVGLKVAVALEGAILGEDYHIKPSKLRGVLSLGMCCSASELGLVESSSGIMELPLDAPIGVSIRDYLELDDTVITLAITPNRGDCLSLAGLARETAAIFSIDYCPDPIKSVTATDQTVMPIVIENTIACPHYVGRVIRHVNIEAETPLWMQERLRRSGLRSIDPIVDVTNYVMLELGQPLHAFDLKHIQRGIVIRDAKPNETLELLNGATVTLDPRFLVIADHERALAIAGIVGGLSSSVSKTTHDIFLESAYFDPLQMANRGRWLGLQTDSAYRFERGVDPSLQVKAIERATEYLLAIVGGEPGPVQEVPHDYQLHPLQLTLSKAQLQRLTGVHFSSTTVESIWRRLGCLDITDKVTDWQVTVPSFRKDIQVAEDLIEEIVRIDGYDNIPTTMPVLPLGIQVKSESDMSLLGQRQCLIELGYREIISYSFVEKGLQERCDPESATLALALQNPISADMNVMRTSLMTGLIQAALYNQRRQQSRGQLFEVGNCFQQNETGEVEQTQYVAGIRWGSVSPLQWAVPSRDVDFFDLKGDLELLLKLVKSKSVSFEPTLHPSYHPGQSALVLLAGKPLGILGQLHPALQLSLDVTQPLFYFECLLAPLCQTELPVLSEVSKFPSIRRDLALLVDRRLPAGVLLEAIKQVAGPLLVDITLFDVYESEKLGEQKSIALSLLWQDHTKTLTDAEVNQAMQAVLTSLYEQHNAILRE